MSSSVARGSATLAPVASTRLLVRRRGIGAWQNARAGRIRPCLLRSRRGAISGSMEGCVVPASPRKCSSLLAPTTLANRYHLLGLLGSGGMGTVYRARDTQLDEIVALKVVKTDLADEPKMIERFRREVKLARRVTHKNVARTFDIGEDDGNWFLTMEYVDGDPLSALVRAGTLPAARSIAIARDLCEGLAASHDAGVVHG